MLRIHALSCGALEFDRSLFFPAEAQGTAMVAPVASWLVVHPQGKVLFDTGISCDALADPAGRLGRRVASLFRIRAGADDNPVARLAALGIEPGDIRTVVNSHFHFDHCGCNTSFPRAQFLVQRAELAMARSEGSRYNPKDWNHPLDYRELDGEHDVFGDGKVVVLPTPGHTAGHQSLWIRDGGRQFVLTSDACYTREHMEKTILPSNAFDPGQMADSLNLLRGLRDRKGARLLYGHDPEQWNALRRSPQPLL